MKTLKKFFGVLLSLFLVVTVFFSFSTEVKRSGEPVLKIAETDSAEYFMQGNEMIKRVRIGEFTRDFLVTILAGKSFFIPLDGDTLSAIDVHEFVKFVHLPLKEKLDTSFVRFFLYSLFFIILYFSSYRRIPWEEKRYELSSIIRSREWFVFAMIPLRDK